MTTPIERTATLAIGTVDAVSPAEIRVILDIDAPQATAMNAGTPTPFPRLNGYILIPGEAGAVVGLVSYLGVERSAFPKRPGLKDYGLLDLPFPLRRITLTPVGTLTTDRVDGRPSYRLLRGVSVFPSVGDAALLPTPAQVEAIVSSSGEDSRVQIGTSPLASHASISVDPNKLFGRHLAVLGNTGSGKSCTVAGVVRWSLDAAKKERANRQEVELTPNARFIILDPNGEYGQAYADLPNVRMFRAPPTPDGAIELRVPAWLWNSQEWVAFAAAAPGAQRPLLLRALRDLRAGQVTAEPTTSQLRRMIRTSKEGFEGRIAQGVHGYSNFPANKNTAVALRRLVEDCETYLATITGADVRERLSELHDLARGIAESRAWPSGTGYDDFAETDLRRVIDATNEVLGQLPQGPEPTGPSEDAPVPFDVSELPDYLEALAAIEGASAQTVQFVATLVMRIRMMLADRRLGPIVTGSEPSLVEWLEGLIGADHASNGNIAIVDLSLVPSDVLHLVVAVIARLVFEGTQRYMKVTASELPTVLVLEEAHTFIHRAVGDAQESPARQMCRETFERIAREGRKFGLGLVLCSQRPSELSPTALAQCNTFILHRIVNDRDQDLVTQLVPDSLSGLLRELPSLPARQAVLLGWATPVPVLVDVAELPFDQRPRSADPGFWEVWSGEAPREVNWEAIAADWHG